MIEIVLGPVGLTLIALLAAGLVVATWVLYRQELHASGLPYAWLLPSLRAGSIVAVLLVLLQPSLRFRRASGDLGKIQIVMDASQSMGLPRIDEGLELPRFARAAQRLVAGRESILEQLSEQHEVRVFSWTDSVSTLWESTVKKKDSLPKSPEAWSPSQFSPRTNLGEALRTFSGNVSVELDLHKSASGAKDAERPSEQIREDRGLPPIQNMSPIVLVSDGRNNSGPSPIEVADQLKKAGRPVFAVAMGSNTEPADIAIAAVDAPKVLLQTDTLRGTIRLRDSLATGTPFRVKIDYGGKEVWSQNLVANADRARSVDFAIDLKEVIPEDNVESVVPINQNRIPLEFSAQVVVEGAEATKENNVRNFRLSATAKRQRVLLLESESRWETRYLRNALERDPNWEVDAYLIHANDRKLWFGQSSEATPFPSTFEDWLKYDVVFVGDLVTGSLDEPSQGFLKRTVEQGGCGLIVIDGFRSAWSQATFEEIAAMLPVRAAGIGRVSGLFQVQLSDAGERLAAFRLGKEGSVASSDAESIWPALPELRAANRVEVLPGSEVLATLSQRQSAVPVRNEPEILPEGGAESDLSTGLESNSSDDRSLPFAVTRFFGAGRVLYLSSDETWRWRYRVADRYHQQFWNQVVRWVMRFPFAVESEFLALDAGHAEYARGEPIAIRAKLRDSDGAPLDVEWVSAMLEKGGQPVGSLALTSDLNLPGVYQGELAQLDPGVYSVRIQAAGIQREALPVSVSFSITEPPSSELIDLSCDRELLRQIAERSGGALLDESEMERLPKMVETYSQGKIENITLKVWSSYYWFVPIVCLLGVEWWLRKRTGLP